MEGQPTPQHYTTPAAGADDYQRAIDRAMQDKGRDDDIAVLKSKIEDIAKAVQANTDRLQKMQIDNAASEGVNHYITGGLGLILSGSLGLQWVKRKRREEEED